MPAQSEGNTLFPRSGYTARNPADMEFAGSFGLIGNLYFHHCNSTHAAVAAVQTATRTAFTETLTLVAAAQMHTSSAISLPINSHRGSLCNYSRPQSQIPVLHPESLSPPMTFFTNSLSSRCWPIAHRQK